MAEDMDVRGDPESHSVGACCSCNQHPTKDSENNMNNNALENTETQTSALTSLPTQDTLSPTSTTIPASYPPSVALNPTTSHYTDTRSLLHSSSNRPGRSTLVRDFILGFADGLTVPFALCAGLSSLENSRLVVLAGLAELFSGAISMGLGCYLAAVTEAKAYEIEERQLYERGRAGELEGKITAQDEADDLYSVFEGYGINRSEAYGVVKALQERRHMFVKFMLDFSLKEEKPAIKGAWIEGAVMGLAYFIGGLLPMIPYFCTRKTMHALIASIVLTAVILLVFGYVKSHITGCARRDNFISAAHTLAVGVVAAGTSYGIVRGFNSLPSL